MISAAVMGGHRKSRSGATVARQSFTALVGGSGRAGDGLRPHATDTDGTHAVPRPCRAADRLRASVQKTNQVAASDGHPAALTQLHAGAGTRKTSVR